MRRVWISGIGMALDFGVSVANRETSKMVTLTSDGFIPSLAAGLPGIGASNPGMEIGALEASSKGENAEYGLLVGEEKSSSSRRDKSKSCSIVKPEGGHPRANSAPRFSP
jgi:hypothetical protein